MGRTRRRKGAGERNNNFTGQDADVKQIACTDKVLAYERLYNRYRERLFYHALGIAKDAEAAQEIVQEVFIKAYREKRLFTQGFQIKAWLYRVTTNTCLNHIRNRKRRAEILEIHGDMLIPEGKDVQRRVYNKQVGGIWGKLITRLSRHHREIIELRFWRGLTYAEISEFLNIKQGTVMSRLSRARAHLAVIAEADGYDADTLDHAA
jgi:RNA polymerase sigma-70 factor (ECF subfamily)